MTNNHTHRKTIEQLENEAHNIFAGVIAVLMMVAAAMYTGAMLTYFRPLSLLENGQFLLFLSMPPLTLMSGAFLIIFKGFKY